MIEAQVRLAAQYIMKPLIELATHGNHIEVKDILDKLATSVLEVKENCAQGLVQAAIDIAICFRGVAHVLDIADVENATDFKDLVSGGPSEQSTSSMRAETLKLMSSSEFVRPLFADASKKTDTHTDTLEAMQETVEEFHAAGDEVARQCCVAKAVGLLGTWRRDARTGCDAIVTEPMSHFVQEFAVKIQSFDFLGSEDDAVIVVQKAKGAVDILEQVIKVGKFPQRTPDWELALTKAKECQPLLSSRVSVASLEPAFGASTARDVLTDPLKRSQLNDLLTTASATTDADRLRTLDSKVRSVLALTAQGLIDSLGETDNADLIADVTPALTLLTRCTSEKGEAFGNAVTQLLTAASQVRPKVACCLVEDTSGKKSVNMKLLEEVHSGRKLIDKLRQDVGDGHALKFETLDGFTRSMTAVVEEGIQLHFATLRAEFGSIADSPYEPKGKEKTSFRQVAGGRVDGAEGTWSDKLTAKDGMKKLRSTLTNTLAKIAPTAFALANGKLQVQAFAEKFGVASGDIGWYGASKELADLSMLTAREIKITSILVAVTDRGQLKIKIQGQREKAKQEGTMDRISPCVLGIMRCAEEGRALRD
ncbi:unnamed protein product [Prorocentrum cordatum]|uniref:Uncharacterized protein n=1 Tax=Prorocentrum cordatum TaxID=2364126 RepID=A0ABN9YHZ6_9DINO|nr:unnamed protein product [Polarella glacialis]